VVGLTVRLVLRVICVGLSVLCVYVCVCYYVCVRVCDVRVLWLNANIDRAVLLCEGTTNNSYIVLDGFGSVHRKGDLPLEVSVGLSAGWRCYLFTVLNSHLLLASVGHSSSMYVV